MAVRLMPYKVSAFGLSDVGLIRQNNEDVWAEIPELFFYALADGMGGHQAGEVAAHEAVNSLCKIVSQSWGKSNEIEKLHDARKTLSSAIEQVNGTVFKISRTDPTLKGMGTTLCCIYLHEKGLVYGYVGDSRIYRHRKRKLEQLSKDHSLFREMVDLGQISEKQGPEFLYKNIITKAIGTEPKVTPTVHLGDIKAGDTYLLCTDGLSDLLSSKEIQNIMNQEMSVEDTARELVATANARGGHDNVTVVLVKVLEANEKKGISR